MNVYNTSGWLVVVEAGETTNVVRLFVLIRIFKPLTSYKTYPELERVAMLKPLKGVFGGLVKPVKVI